MKNLYEAIKDKEMSGKELASCAASQVNSFGSQKDIYNQIMSDDETCYEFLCMAFAFTKDLAVQYTENRYDGRNEAACKVAYALTKNETFRMVCRTATEWDGSMDIMQLKRRETKSGHKASRECEFACNMRNEHRTLQQSFANLAFHAIHDMFYNPETYNLSEKIGCINGEVLREADLDAYLETCGFYKWYKLPLI